MKERLDYDIRQYVFPYIDANMYILIEGNEALVIDPHISYEAGAYLKENKVTKVMILLTHEHFDHTCGIPWFRKNFDTRVICQKEALDRRRQKHFGRPLVVALILADRGENEKIKKLEAEYSLQMITAEYTFSEELDFTWMGHSIHLEHVPGHSPASSLIIMDDFFVFTGDSLIPGAEPTIRWPWSDAEVYMEKTVPRLRRIDKKCMIYPGHRSPIKMADIVFENNMFIIREESKRKYE